MNFTCLQKNLAEGLGIVSRVVSTTGSLPVLSNILLETHEGRLKLAATDLETGVVVWVGAKVTADGAITVPARVFSRLVANLASEEVSITVDKQILKLKAQGVESEFNGLAASEFPNLPEYKAETGFELPGPLLAEGLNQVVLAAAQDEGRPVLTGVYFLGEGHALTLVGVDGFRLAEKKIVLETEIPSLSLVVPAKTLRELGLILGKHDEKVMISQDASENQIVFQVGDISLSSRLLEGEFPKYREIIPQEFTTKVILPREGFLKAVNLASIFTPTATNIVRLEVDPEAGLVTVSANTQEVGSNKVEVAGKVEGDAVTIAFNAKYLADCLGALACEEISFEVMGSLKPGLIRPVGSDDYLHVVMPVRVQD